MKCLNEKRRRLDDKTNANLCNELAFSRQPRRPGRDRKAFIRSLSARSPGSTERSDWTGHPKRKTSGRLRTNVFLQITARAFHRGLSTSLLLGDHGPSAQLAAGAAQGLFGYYSALPNKRSGDGPNLPIFISIEALSKRIVIPSLFLV